MLSQLHPTEKSIKKGPDHTIRSFRAHYLIKKGSILCVRKDCHLTSTLDSGGKLSLVLSTVAGDTAGKDLSSLRDILTKLVSILVIDYVVLTAENAHLSTSCVHSAPSSGRSFRSLRFGICHDCLLQTKNVLAEWELFYKSVRNVQEIISACCGTLGLGT